MLRLLQCCINHTTRRVWDPGMIAVGAVLGIDSLGAWSLLSHNPNCSCQTQALIVLTTTSTSTQLLVWHPGIDPIQHPRCDASDSRPRPATNASTWLLLFVTTHVATTHIPVNYHPLHHVQREPATATVTSRQANCIYGFQSLFHYCHPSLSCPTVPNV